MNTQPLSWLRQLQQELLLAKKIPLLGSPPSFPFEALSSELSKEWTKEPVHITLTDQQVLSPEAFLASFGAHPKMLFFELAPLVGTLFWIISSESIEKLSSLLLASNPHIKGFTDPLFQTGFYEFLLIQASSLFVKLNPYQDLHLQWIEEAPFPTSPCIALDLLIQIEESRIPQGSSYLLPSRRLFLPIFPLKPRILFLPLFMPISL